MIRIEITSAAVQDRQIPSKKSGELMHFREQEGYAFTYDREGKPNKYPTKIRISLDVEDAKRGTQEQPAYLVGAYQLAPQSVYVDKFGGLTIGKPKLLALQQAQQVKAA